MILPPDAENRPAPVLVVDDAPTNRYVLATTLRRAGHAVVEAEDGTRALELLGGPDPLPELAIVDVRLPGMTGFEVCERIKGDPATAAVAVINVSASAITVDDRAQGLNRGADAYLVEPVAPTNSSRPPPPTCATPAPAAARNSSRTGWTCSTAPRWPCTAPRTRTNWSR